jgi:hypothetical protein
MLNSGSFGTARATLWESRSSPGLFLNGGLCPANGLGQTQGNLGLSPRGGLPNLLGRTIQFPPHRGLAISNGREPFLLSSRQVLKDALDGAI